MRCCLRVFRLLSSNIFGHFQKCYHYFSFYAFHLCSTNLVYARHHFLQSSSETISSMHQADLANIDSSPSLRYSHKQTAVSFSSNLHSLLKTSKALPLFYYPDYSTTPPHLSLLCFSFENNPAITFTAMDLSDIQLFHERMNYLDLSFILLMHRFKFIFDCSWSFFGCRHFSSD